MKKEPVTPAPALPLTDQVKERLGPERLAKLAETPGAIALGGMDAVVQEACTLCAGFPQPVISASVRTLQLCGCKATAEDLVGLNPPT